MKDFSYLNAAHPQFIEELYKTYKTQNGQSGIDPDWKKFFDGFDYAHERIDGENNLNPKEFNVVALINSYRERAHLLSTTNPIRQRKDRHAKLDLATHGLSEKDLQENFIAGQSLGLGTCSLQKIIQHLEKIYIGNVGYEYAYMLDTDQEIWLQNQIEKGLHTTELPLPIKKRILEKLNETVLFEKFLSTKYIGQKRFSLEGGESTIPALDAIIETAAEAGALEVVIGMAHRGRLNVLANILGKSYDQIFNEFEGNNILENNTDGGDVKYHLGYSSLIETLHNKKINVKLCPNPSHLEAVAPVVCGFTRAKLESLYNNDSHKIVPILIHGDAAIAGQGICYEVLQMSELKGYSTGGSIHFVINNQIGFTTDFEDARSSNYCTSLASVVNAPVFHVNGDDPEAVVHCCKLAVAFRNQFKKDVFIDMVCYRKHGHNEGDDPQYTQPDMYRRIASHKNPRELYIDMLLQRGDIEAALAKQLEQDFWAQLQAKLDLVKQKELPYQYQELEQVWQGFKKNATDSDVEKTYDTNVSSKTISIVMKALHEIPEDFKPLKKAEKMLQGKWDMFNKDKKMDWQMAELLAYGTLLHEGFRVRLSGQDVKRGTFSHRHAVLTDEVNNSPYVRLSKISENQGECQIINSLLSEYGVLGFEYGYSLAQPNALTIWEAQFGDFSNGAQIIIDQFITSAETKWQRMSGLVMLLPHGYEGQGPEHSSARMERYLQSCANNNIVVTNITTPANFFHVLRRQIVRPFRKPLINMSPKSLLRHNQCVSTTDEFYKGSFQEVIEDKVDSKKINRVVYCTGKIYYDLLEQKNSNNLDNVLLVRIEQLYPCPNKQIDAIDEKYKKAKKIWCQEEPANMGTWLHWKMHRSKWDITLVSRKINASPATGFNKIHQQEQIAITKEALGL